MAEQSFTEKFMVYFDQFAKYAAEDPKDFLLSCKLFISLFFIDFF